jgi:hypothetical protein
MKKALFERVSDVSGGFRFTSKCIQGIHVTLLFGEEKIPKSLIKNLYLKSHSLFVVNTIYTYHLVKRYLYIPISSFFRKGISKVSTLHTSCVHLNLYNRLYRGLVGGFPSDSIEKDSVQRVSTTRNLKWNCVNDGLYIKRPDGMSKLVVFIRKKMVRRWITHHFWGDDYE